MGHKKLKRRVTRIKTGVQLGFDEFDSEPGLVPGQVEARRPAIRFEDPDPREIRIGMQRLDAHLREMGLRDALVLREILSEQDWSAFEAQYSPVGRPGYAPWLMAGVVLFGLMRGITPDHSILGRFITRHAEALSGALFTSVTEAVLKRTHSGRARLAGDGTVLEAMSSRFALVKREALEAQWGESAEGSAAREALERARAALCDRPNAKAVVVGEPEAGLLKLKNGRGRRPAYQAAVLVNEARVVLDAQVHSTSEQAALAEPLERLDGTQTQELLLDAGFNSYAVLECALEKDISLLCPEQAEDGQRQGKQPRLFALCDFRYVEDGDHYLCPAGAQLYPSRRCAGNPQKGLRAYVQYSTPACGTCERRAQCTQAEVRTIQRSAGQELKEALRQVMAQPRARQVFAQRKAMVEPVFSMLRERQGLNRFRRRGLSRVRLEFRLHLTAYNLGRALAYARRRRRLDLLLRLARRFTTQCPAARQRRGRLTGRYRAALSVRLTPASPGLA